MTVQEIMPIISFVGMIYAFIIIFMTPNTWKQFYILTGMVMGFVILLLILGRFVL
mgnify:CR=1 FL=1